MNPAWPRSNRQCRKDVPDQGNPYNLPTVWSNSSPHFQSKEEIELLAQNLPLGLFQAGPAQREEKNKKRPVNFLSLDICRLHPVELLDGVLDGVPICSHSQIHPRRMGYPVCPGKKRMLFSQQTNHPQIVQATVTK